MTLLSFKEFSFSYSPDLPPALRNISLTINERETLVVSGLSGAGKTTLCLAAADLFGSYPSVITSGEAIRSMSGQDRSRTAIVMQNFYAQITYLRSSVFEEIAFPCENLGLGREEIIRRVNQAIERTRIEPLAWRNPLQLSGGEKQKVVLASALAMKPDLLILDEPLSQLDPESMSYLGDLLVELKDEMSILIAENDPYLALKVADRVMILSSGEIIADGRLEDILSPATEQHLELPAWTKCVSEVVRREKLAHVEREYELNYRRAISILKNAT